MSLILSLSQSVLPNAYFKRGSISNSRFAMYKKFFYIKKEKDIRLIVFMGTFNELRYKFHKFVPLGRNE